MGGWRLCRFVFARDGEAEGLEFSALVFFYDFFAEFFGEGREEV